MTCRANFFVFLVFASLVALNDAQIPQPGQPARCVTTTGYNGFCVNIYNCAPLIRMLRQVPLLQADRDYLRSNQCGVDGRSPMVCCVPEMSAAGPIL